MSLARTSSSPRSRVLLSGLAAAVLAVGAASVVMATPAPPPPVTFQVFATREGIIAGVTANGHVIVPHDHFVALPSGSVLACNGCYTYQVTISYKGRTTTQPVWDIGPWNIADNYWHTPRNEFADLPVGLPGAQAAFQRGYNGGRDESGRTVGNPAGIDLADGVFWDDLGMTDNDWVTVTYNWETGGPAASRPPGLAAPPSTPLPTARPAATVPPAPSPTAHPPIVAPPARPTPRPTLAPTRTPGPQTWPPLTLGNTGERVRTATYLLRAQGFTVTHEDLFWGDTETAVRAVQTRAGLPATGVVDAATWELLILPVGPGAAGDAVRAVQSQLLAHGYTTGEGFTLTVDGTFGLATEGAIRRFQVARGLPQDATVDAATWNALLR